MIRQALWAGGQWACLVSGQGRLSYVLFPFFIFRSDIPHDATTTRFGCPRTLGTKKKSSTPGYEHIDASTRKARGCRDVQRHESGACRCRSAKGWCVFRGETWHTRDLPFIFFPLFLLLHLRSLVRKTSPTSLITCAATSSDTLMFRRILFKQNDFFARRID